MPNLFSGLVLPGIPYRRTSHSEDQELPNPSTSGPGDYILCAMPIDVPCPQCGKFAPLACECPPLPPGPESPPSEPSPPPPKEKKPRTEVIMMRREKRRGRDIIVLEGFPADVNVKELSRDIRRKCATGGTFKGRTIEIRGDHRDTIAEILLTHRFRSKRSGG
mgnify:CR=1 FL=1